MAVSESDYAQLNLSPAPRIQIPPPGPKSRALLEEQRRYDSAAIVYPNQVPLAIERALGATVQDLDGNVYLDFSGGVGALNVGHSHPEVVAAIAAQAARVAHGLDFPSEARVAMSRTLVRLAPCGLKHKSRVLLCGPTGADAIEAAIKLARFTTKRPGIIAFEGGWHGVSGSALAATGKRAMKANYLPVMPEVSFAPYPYCYRCPFGLTHPDCGLQCAAYLEHLIRDPDTGVVAPGAVLIEPIQGEGGIVVPPDGYLQEVRRICDAHGLLLIADEIQTGFGRTGRMFACEHPGVTPDIMTVSKSMGGSLPLSGIVFREELDRWGPAAHVGTFRGNAVACAAGNAALAFIERADLTERSARLGEEAKRRCEELLGNEPEIGDLRGRGLYIGLELVRERSSKEPGTELLSRLQHACFDQGLIVWKGGRWANVSRIMPALVITEEHLHRGIELMARELRGLAA